MINGFDVSELSNFSKDLLSSANELKNGKESKKFLNKEGSKLAKKQKESFKSKGIGTGGEDSTEVAKSFKKGKVYKFQGDLAIRAFSGNPLTHLLNNGHRIVSKSGEEKGFAVGYHFIEDAEKGFESEFHEDTEGFLDNIFR